ncbi:MAG: hypothetical protein JWM59_3822 [Verrucomicrobiales bacterium]|nr:hypothetical protein [Verrucomicrobiales bacterium]
MDTGFWVGGTAVLSEEFKCFPVGKETIPSWGWVKLKILQRQVSENF